MKRINSHDTIRRTRKVASESLVTVLTSLLASKKPISEVVLRDSWLEEMRKNDNIFPDGWYTPPPHGIIVLFATDKNVVRLNYKSARPKEQWPRDDVFLDSKKGLLYCYASPVDKESGIIGDFGVTLYFGKKGEIKNLLKTCLKLDREIFDYVKVSLKFSEISLVAEKLMKKDGMVNEVLSITDKGNMVIGHTIPDSFDSWSKKEKIASSAKDWNAIKEIISSKRINVKKKEPFVIQKGSAFTIEPRPRVVEKPDLPESLSYHTIAVFNDNGEKELLTDFDQLFKLVGMDYMQESGKEQKITYSQVGDNYDTKDPIKILAQNAASDTGKNLREHGFEEISDTRGESAFVWKQGSVFMASVTEGLGTKNLVADGMREFTGKTYYDVIGHDTVATIINDLITVGAKPLVVHAYWSIEDNEWLQDKARMTDLITGWKNACDISGATWGGGETATMKGITVPNTADLAGCAIGIIEKKKKFVTGQNLLVGDRILLLKSSGVNANGISLTRAIATKLPKGYGTQLSDGSLYGEVLLTKTNIYAKLIQDLLDAGITIHYISNITGHGLRKIMRAKKNVTYVIEDIYAPQEIFNFIQEHAGLSNYEMYDTYNMGMDYAIFLPEKDVKKAQEIVKKNKFESLNAGYIEKGERQVIITPKDIIFTGDRLLLR